MLRKSCFFIALLAFGSMGASATVLSSSFPTCPSAPLSVYLSSGYECVFDQVVGPDSLLYDVTVRSVSYTFFDLNPLDPTAAVSPADIMVTPPTKIGEALGFSSMKFDIKGNQHVVFDFRYVVDPPPPVFPGFETELDTFTPKGGGTAVLETELCVDGFFKGGACSAGGTTSFPIVTLKAFYISDPKGGDVFQLKDSVIFPTPARFISVHNILELKANGGTSQITGINNVAGITVPEPMAALLVGAGLIGLALLRWRP